jgi:hypothetical protein
LAADASGRLLDGDGPAAVVRVAVGELGQEVAVEIAGDDRGSATVATGSAERAARLRPTGRRGRVVLEGAEAPVLDLAADQVVEEGSAVGEVVAAVVVPVRGGESETPIIPTPGRHRSKAIASRPGR